MPIYVAIRVYKFIFIFIVYIHNNILILLLKKHLPRYSTFTKCKSINDIPRIYAKSLEKNNGMIVIIIINIIKDRKEIYIYFGNIRICIYIYDNRIICVRYVMYSTLETATERKSMLVWLKKNREYQARRCTLPRDWIKIGKYEAVISRVFAYSIRTTYIIINGSLNDRYIDLCTCE